MAEFLKQAVKLGHETTIFGFSTSKCIHLPPFTLLQLHNMSQGKTCELVSRTRERSSLRPENPETPKSSASVLKNMVTYPPPTHTFLKWPFHTDFKKYTYTPPPPPGNSEW